MNCEGHVPYTEIKPCGSDEPVAVFCACGHRIHPPIPAPDTRRPVERFIQTGALDV